MQKIFASVITIGDELLIGQVIDTNSAWIAQELNKIGILVKQRLAVGDNAEDIIKALDETAKESSVVLITGGLGPTADDITKDVLCQYFGGKLIMNEDALKKIISISETLKRPLIERNKKQAEVPDVCTVIQNERGTAPGMWFEKNGIIYVSMPGVPHEMKGMMENYVLAQLQKKLRLPFIIHKTLLTAGIGESFLADMIEDWEKKLPTNIKLAYLPNYGMVRLRLTGVDNDKDKLETQISQQFEMLQSLVKDYLVTNKDEPMQQVIAEMLLERNETITTAESCTGGYIAHLLTSIPGSSSYYSGSIISYSYEAKENMLLVDKHTLETKGAVSEEVVTQMVKGALIQMKTTYAIAVSGIMGPGGATDEKPVGTVWAAVGSNERIVTQKFHFRFDRMRNIEWTAISVLNLLRKFMMRK